MIVAYRMWHKRKNALVSTTPSPDTSSGLTPYGNRYIWKREGNIFTCECNNLVGNKVFEHLKPTLTRSCGFHAYKELELLFQWYVMGYRLNGEIIGAVALYGTIVECKYGYRAEKADILALFYDCPAEKQALTPIAEAYNLPLSPLPVRAEPKLLPEGRG